MILIEDKSIDARLADAHLKIITARDDLKINGPMLNFGFDENKYAEGFQLYTTAFDLQKFQKLEYGDQYKATVDFQGALTEMEKIHMQNVTVARVAFKNYPHLLKTADLEGERKVTYTGWLTQAQRFYNVILATPEATGLLANFGLTTEKLTADSQQLANVHVLKVKQIHESGDAQDVTEKRDLALEVLEAWVADLVTIARVALVDSPQLLEKMGIKVE